MLPATAIFFKKYVMVIISDRQKTGRGRNSSKNGVCGVEIKQPQSRQNEAGRNSIVVGGGKEQPLKQSRAGAETAFIIWPRSLH